MPDNTSESLAELYFAKLKSSTNPGVVLAQFYSALTGKEVGKSEIMRFNMLLKVFGKSTVFFSIIDTSRVETITEFPYGLLYKICKDRLEATLHVEMTSASSDNLDRKITKTMEEILKVKKLDPEKFSKFLDNEKIGDKK